MEVTAAAQPTPRASARKATSPWERQPFDTDLWFARFLFYMALGPRRSVSKAAMGRPNAYPVPAHWPIQARQLNWKARAEAFDAEAIANPSLVTRFNTFIRRDAEIIIKATRPVVRAFAETIIAAGYQPLPPDDYEEPAPPPEPVSPTRPIARQYADD